MLPPTAEYLFMQQVLTAFSLAKVWPDNNWECNVVRAAINACSVLALVMEVLCGPQPWPSTMATLVATTMGLCMAIVFWRTSSRMLTKSLTEAAAKLPEVRARWNEMERKSHKFLKATEKDIREFASATFGDGAERDEPVTNDGTEDSAPWGQQSRKGARRLLLT